MKNLLLAFVLGTAAGWTMHERQRIDGFDEPDDLVVQHPQQNAFGTGSGKTRIKLYSVGDVTYGPIPEGTTNGSLWIVTIHGVNFRGVAQE